MCKLVVYTSKKVINIVSLGGSALECHRLFSCTIGDKSVHLYEFPNIDTLPGWLLNFIDHRKGCTYRFIRRY